ncbi:hypothetical protein M231_04710 [Tremella mesenterica]|uniref:Uncharacterized protein n=1 Tax=Tremella mesenterica TaxID=5217 RepID=A0A4Q1BJW1_TREME|nr:hypothetical protein M231_04710 [Tremella mesenterica]
MEAIADQYPDNPLLQLIPNIMTSALIYDSLLTFGGFDAQSKSARPVETVGDLIRYRIDEILNIHCALTIIYTLSPPEPSTDAPLFPPLAATLTLLTHPDIASRVVGRAMQYLTSSRLIDTAIGKGEAVQKNSSSKSVGGH